MSIHSHAPDSPNQPRHYSSVRTYLLLLVVAILVPMLALAATISWYYVDAARQTIAAQRLDVANNLNNLVEREIGLLAGFLEGLAASKAFLAGEPEAVDMASQMAAARGLESVAVFDSSKRLLFASATGARRQAAPLPDRIGIGQALAQNRMVASELQSEPGGPHLFFVSVPVSMSGRPTVVVSGAVAVSGLQKLFAEAGLREGWRAGIVDRAGTIVARSREPEVYVGRLSQRPMIEAAQGRESSGLFDVVSRDGMEIRNSFRRSPITGWTVGVAVPAPIENAPYWSAGLSLGAASMCLILLGLSLAAGVAYRITYAVRTIGRAVVAFATNDSVPIPRATLLEFRDVWRLIESLSAVRPKGVYISP